MGNEAEARIKIDKQLEKSGWRLLDDENGPKNVLVESSTTKSNSRHGSIDYLLLDNYGKPFIVLEAKNEDKEPLVGKEQARDYALNQNVNYIILSNGEKHYWWDIESGNPELITVFPSQDSLVKKTSVKVDKNKLIEEHVGDDYVAFTQMPDYAKRPDYINEETRLDFTYKNNLRFLRYYQSNAVKSIQTAVKKGKDRFLFEMATGTGKTMTAAAVIKLFLRTGNAHRVLFLVDRIELEDQAYKAFRDYLKNDYDTVIYKQNKNDWRKAEIVVTTVQSLMVNNKYMRKFSPTDFDLVISDEAHRSIGGNSRAVFEYFIGYKLGLTATPKDYLKKIADVDDPRESERRTLLDTYETFGCETGDPTFRYSLLDGVKDNFLINPTTIDARTEITTQLLSDDGYSLPTIDENGEEVDTTYRQRDFEKKFFSDITNRVLCKTLLDNALKDPITLEIGKSLVFCVSQKHAVKVTQILNELATEMFPGKYNSDFAVQVTSWIPTAQEDTIKFTNNNLKGNSKWLDGYRSSKARMCVTVGMMTTGYDCPDVLNLALMRPIFSPTDFIQIKGRGTRKNTFNFEYRDDFGDTQRNSVNKETYHLFDFFANCEYFEDKYDYDQILKLPKKSKGTGEGDPRPVVHDDFEYSGKDKISQFEREAVGVEGMKVDRMFFQDFETKISGDQKVKQLAEVDPEAAASYITENILDKPKEFFTIDKLRKALGVDRKISMREVVDKIFNGEEIKMKDDLLNEEFNKFLSIHKPSDDVLALKYFFRAYLTDKKVREVIDSKNYGQLLSFDNFDLEDFKKIDGTYRDIIPKYIKSHVPINKFAA